MAKFARATTQARNVIKGLTKNNLVKSLGTARNYEQSLKTVAAWAKDIGINGIQAMTIEEAGHYLEYRSELVGQKALDMERQAIQAMMKLNGKLDQSQTLTRTKSLKLVIRQSRAYTYAQVHAIAQKQTSSHQFATELAYAAGLRAHELLTLAKIDDRAADVRPRLQSKLDGREGELYTVKDKGGLVREVLIPSQLAFQLEQIRLAQPTTIRDREINYLQRYEIGGGKKWSDSFSKASTRALYFSTGAHGLRHSYAQERMLELNKLGYNREAALATVSQEMGHFRPEITLVYLR